MLTIFLMDCLEKTHDASLVYPLTTYKVFYNSLNKKNQIPMHLEVTNFGDKKTVFFLEKVIIRLYNFTWGFYSQNTKISC